jgi:hypothetical protein
MQRDRRLGSIKLRAASMGARDDAGGCHRAKDCRAARQHGGLTGAKGPVFIPTGPKFLCG